MLLALGSINASAQDGWTSVIKNGDFEGEGNSNFFVKEEATGDNAVYAAKILEGIGKNDTKGIRIQAAKATSGDQDWDTQFWIKFDKTLPSGTKVKISFDYRAATDETVGTQVHALPGDYLHWNAIGNLSFTTEWKSFSSTWTVGTGDNNAELKVQSLAFNMACGKQYNDFYLDNFVVMVEDAVYETLDDTDTFEPAEQTPQEVQVISEDDEELYDKTIADGWENLITNGDLEGEGFDNFVVNDYPDPNDKDSKVAVGAPRIIADPANENNKCIIVSTDVNPAQDYDAQLFITVPEDQKFNVGDKIQLKMRVKADVSQSAGSQCHAGPGSYIHYECLGSVNFKKMWTNFVSKEVEVNSTMVGAANNFRTIAFNLSTIAEGNNVYFDEIQLLVKRLPDPLMPYKSALSTAIGKGEGMTDYLKTEESYAALTEAIADAKTALEAAESQESLEAATKAITDAIAGLEYVEGYTALTKEMFLKYASVDSPGEGSATGCGYALGESVDMPYGDGNVGELNWADLTNYDKLIIVTTGETKPRLCMNRLVAGGQQAATMEESNMIDINPNNDFSWSTEKYLTVEDNVYTVDLAAIVADFGFARLHSIKKQGWGAGVTVTDLILAEASKIETVTIGEDLWASFAPSKDVTVPEGVKAYAVALDESNKFVTLEEVTEITAGTPVIVNATEAGEYTFEAADGASFSASNDLDVSDGSIVGNGSIYVLANGSNDVGFYLLAEGVTLPAGKAYLEVAGGAREFIGFGNATAIKAIETLKNNGVIYNLAGQQVKSAQKGVFIVNGKKVIK